MEKSVYEKSLNLLMQNQILKCGACDLNFSGSAFIQPKLSEWMDPESNQMEVSGSKAFKTREGQFSLVFNNLEQLENSPACPNKALW